MVLANGKSTGGGGRGRVIWSSGFLPAVYQGTAFRPGDPPILNLARPDLVSEPEQRATLDLLKRLNQHQSAKYPFDSAFAAVTEIARDCPNCHRYKPL